MATSNPSHPPLRPGAMTTPNPPQHRPHPEAGIQGSSSSDRPRFGGLLELGRRPPWARKDKPKNASSASHEKEAALNKNDGMKARQDTDHAVTAENQQINNPEVLRCTWTIDNISSVGLKLYSDIFLAGGCKWRVLIFSNGNNVEFLSVYLNAVDLAEMPDGWYTNAKFSLSVVNQVQNKYTVRKETHHQFSVQESDWGFTSFMPLSDFYSPNKGYVVNDTCIIEAEVVVCKIVEYLGSDSQMETRYTGLQNQGLTCSLNALVQTLYHIPLFRKAVCDIISSENTTSMSILFALQRLFRKLQYDDSSASTEEFTESLGWSKEELSVQQDVHELNVHLFDKLAENMKLTPANGTIKQLFKGRLGSYIQCINIDNRSEQHNDFYDIELDVKGCQDIYASFDKYVDVQHLESYDADMYGSQVAKKNILFIAFPPVLRIIFKRFEYDKKAGTARKVNDRCEFPLQLDLDRDDGKYLSYEADRNVRNLYTLYSVIVHSGDTGRGHYYAFIRPTLCDQWFKFDDDRVTKVDESIALLEQYGGEELFDTPGLNSTPNFINDSSAYVLVYIRESEKEKIMFNVDERKMAEYLRIRLEMDTEEKQKADPHLYINIKVVLDQHLEDQIGKDIYFDLVNHDNVPSFHVQEHIPFTQFKKKVAKELGIPVQFQRFWLWAKRQNHTCRLSRPLTSEEEALTVGKLNKAANKAHSAELKLFLEVERGLGKKKSRGRLTFMSSARPSQLRPTDLKPLPLPHKSAEDILLFFKLYDPEKEQLRYVGRLFVKASEKPQDILPKLREMAGFSHEEEVELYEEIRFEPLVMCDYINNSVNFQSCELQDGDIVCFQKILKTDTEHRYPDVSSFLVYIRNKKVLHLRPLEKPKEHGFPVETSMISTYDEVVEKVAKILKVDQPSKIQLRSHDCYSQLPEPQPIKCRGTDCVKNIQHNQTSDILYYEVLDVPVIPLVVAYHHSTKDQVSLHSIRLPGSSTVRDVLSDIKSKVELSHPNAELRLLEVFYHKIYKIFRADEKIENISYQYWTLRAEEVPEEEEDENIGAGDRLIPVCHFTVDTRSQRQIQNFGEPFFMVIHADETLFSVKERIQKKLNIPYENFSKWKFAYVSLGEPSYLEDLCVVATIFQREQNKFCEQYLGLEHQEMPYQSRYFLAPWRQLKLKFMAGLNKIWSILGGRNGY